MSASDLEERIAQLEDIEAIKKLKASYCLHVDHANEEGWVSLFTEDAVWESDKFGRFEGREVPRNICTALPVATSITIVCVVRVTYRNLSAASSVT